MFRPGLVLALVSATTASAQHVPAADIPLRFETNGQSINLRASEIGGVAVSVEDGIHALTMDIGRRGSSWLLANTVRFQYDQQIEIFVCGQSVAAPMVLEPIVNGQIKISGGPYSEDTFSRAAAVLSGAADCQTGS